MKRCRICDSSISPFVSFGRMPFGNGFLSPGEFEREYFFDLDVGMCEACGMVQLLEQPPPEQMFHENYAFLSSTSKRMAEHFGRLADRVMREYVVDSEPFVVEIGCNDGITLEHFARRGVSHLGIEPAENVAQAAEAKGIQMRVAFFSGQLAEEVMKEHGAADVVLATNVMCHIPDLNPVVAGIATLLKPQGVLVFEDPYVGDIIEKTSYDQIYDEHVFYFSLGSLSRLFKQHGLEVIDVEPQPVHGGSMRYVVAHQGVRTVSSAVARQLHREQELGLGRLETYLRFREHVERSREKLVDLLETLRREGRRIAGYGATSKSTTVINYCGITPARVEYISDTTPTKQGKYSPGAHIPVRPYEAFKTSYPDYALLFAWNHAEEIMAKEEPFRVAGGRWIVYVPDVRVL